MIGNKPQAMSALQSALASHNSGCESGYRGMQTITYTSIRHHPHVLEALEPGSVVSSRTGGRRVNCLARARRGADLKGASGAARAQGTRPLACVSALSRQQVHPSSKLDTRYLVAVETFARGHLCGQEVACKAM